VALALVVTAGAAQSLISADTDNTANTTDTGGRAVAEQSVTGAIGHTGAALSTAAVHVDNASKYQLWNVKLADSSTVIARWNPCQPAITYRVNLKGVAAAKRNATLKLVKAAFVKLAAADGLKYAYRGTTQFVPQKSNSAEQPAEIVVAAVPRTSTDLGLTRDSLGYGGLTWVTWSGSGSHGDGAAVVRGYVVLDSKAITRLKPGFGAGRTLGNLVLHELGHATGLEHTAATGEQMNPTLSDSSPNGYAAGDLAGLAKIGTAAGCITIPAGLSPADQN
jgi:hypothetical protein